MERNTGRAQGWLLPADGKDAHSEWKKKNAPATFSETAGERENGDVPHSALESLSPGPGPSANLED